MKRRMIGVMLVLGFIIVKGTVTAYAHGYEGIASVEAGLRTSTVAFLVLGLAAIIFGGLYFLERSKERKKSAVRYQRLGTAAAAGLVLVGGYNMYQAGRTEPVVLTHIHGMGYVKEGRALFAAHDGLKAYENGHWSAVAGDKHDYMGFAAVRGGFFSSGHPAPGSRLKEPLGLVTSSNEGQSLELLALHGQTDFHLLAASYDTGTVYVYNPQPTETIKSVGLYYTRDQGKTWTFAGEGLKGGAKEPSALAVHPSQDSVAALGTVNGLYLTSDYGKTFIQSLPGIQITALYYTPAGNLIVGGYQDGAVLMELDADGKSASRQWKLPPMTEDAVAYIAQHPSAGNEWVLATYKRDVYHTEDDGATWHRIAQEGKTSDTQ